MPNWVYNTIKGKKKDLEYLVKKNDFSFKTIIGMPKLLFLMDKNRYDLQGKEEEIILNSLKDDEQKKKRLKQELKQDFNSNFKKIKNSIKKQLLKNNFKMINWYNWNINNWGCKWDASDIRIEQDEEEIVIEFKTPWACPEPIINALIERKVNLHYEWIEEQGPESLGYFDIIAGEKTNEYVPKPWSKEAYELMFEWWGNSDEYRWCEKKQKYEWKDEDEEVNDEES